MSTMTSTSSLLDHTHDPARRSWVESANADAADYPIQNLPLGVFRPARAGGAAAGEPRIGVAIGDSILDVRACVEAGILAVAPETLCALSATTLNDFLGRGRDAWTETRRAVADLLDEGCATIRDDAALREKALVRAADADMLMPVAIGDYTDFYCSIHHATNVGSMFRPDNPLLPNYKHLPIGYHGRASSIVPSGSPVRRPHGQTIAADATDPTFGPIRLLDYEMELGFFTGPENGMGERIAMADAGEHIFGMCVVNDWSARDVQKWEYQPLGPFNAKNFCTTISPWIVTLDALAPYRRPAPERDADDPAVLDYLQPAAPYGLDIIVEVYVASATMREQGTAPMRVSKGNFRDMYWTIEQMLVHHSSTGCNFRPGDLIASGTVSGPEEESRGCLLERTWRGQQPLDLPDGTQRKFLQDGDEVTMVAYCEIEGAKRIGFGTCTGIIEPAGQ
jgi:fumarylacetoacetase